MQTSFLVEVEKPTPRHLVRELPAQERPIDRLNHFGEAALATAELIACVLGTPDALDLAEELLITFGHLPKLARTSRPELAQIKGMGRANIARLKAALELGRRLMIARDTDKLQISSPADAANMLMLTIGHAEQEELHVLILNTKNEDLKDHTVYVGNVNTTIMRTCEVFKEAIRYNATAIIIVHNHPSGDPTPSPEDVRVTRALVETGELLDIQVLDHLIIGHGRYVSLKERGLGFG